MNSSILSRALLALFAASPALAIAASAHDHHGGAPHAKPAAQAELGASAAFDAQGALWAVHKADGRIVVSRSADHGRSWSAPTRVTPELEPTDAGADARPKIALGPAGEIYVTWTKPLAKPYTGAIRFSRSLDGGRSFSPAAIVHRDRQEITHRFDALAVAGDGRIVVAWIDKRDLVAASPAHGGAKSSYRGAAVYFAVSDDRGETFRGDFKAADHSCECCRIALARRADGSITAMWRHVFEPNVRDHACATLFTDGRAGPLSRATFDDWRVDACPHQGPALAEDPAGRLHAVWCSLASNDPGVFYGAVGAGAVQGRRKIGGDTAAHADIAVSGSRVAIAWKEFDGERTRLRGLLSPDHGKTWREHELAATAGASDHPRVLTHANRFHVLWNTREQPLSVTTFP